MSSSQQFEKVRVKAERPLMIWDGECRFCRIWIEYWKRLTGDRIEYAPFQEVADQFPEIPRKEFEKSVQLIIPSEALAKEGRPPYEVFSGAKAVFGSLALARSSQNHWLWWLYGHLPGFALVSEATYNFIASHRRTLSRLCSR